ncbi:MAG: MFS transporter, partial [Gemmatimonadaceae bacterium]
MTDATAVPASRAGRREWIGLAVIALPCLLYSMDLTVLNLAVPSLSADLAPSSAQLLWIVDIYGFLVAGSLITMGTLGDRIGRRRLLLIGATAFGIASVLAALSRSAEMLIATRALLGLAGATLAPSTLSLIRNMFLDPEQRTFAIGVWATSYSVGAAIGPLLGGLLLQRFWWGSVFLVSVPVMVLLLVVGPLLLPEFRDPNAGRMDMLSAALSLVGVLSVIYGLKRIAMDGFGLPPMLWIAAGITAGIVFVRRQQALADPLIDLRLFRAPAFSAALATNSLSLFAAFGAFLFIAQYLQSVLGLSPMQAGLWTVPSSGGFIVGSMLAPALARRVHRAFVMAGGLALAALGFGILTQVDAVSGPAIVVAGSVVMALGIAPVVTLSTDIIVGTAPPERAGAASAISETGAEFGGALGIAILGSLGAAVYRSEVADGLPAGIPPAAAEAARQTLGGAVAAAAQLPDQLGAALTGAAREAFARALEATATVSASI